MKLKEGMYVRIKNNVGYCVIGKIENINDFREPLMKYCIDIQSNDFIFVPEEIITKASNNIIELIEVGDYVNGKQIIAIGTRDNEKIVRFASIAGCWYMNDEITSIVTKEQFESMSYKVGE